MATLQCFDIGLTNSFRHYKINFQDEDYIFNIPKNVKVGYTGDPEYNVRAAIKEFLEGHTTIVYLHYTYGADTFDFGIGLCKNRIELSSGIYQKPRLFHIELTRSIYYDVVCMLVRDLATIAS